jgi:Tol biopolymer transport system component/DNA-binding winged helix-turn-helix (wHTH) protein
VKEIKSSQIRHIYEFSNFRLDAAERVLIRDGEPVALTDKAFDTLVALVEDAGHLLSRNQLMEKIWPEQFVEENNLTQNISMIRRALGEGEGTQKYIETVPRRGYRFVAPVRKAQGETVRVIVHEHRRANLRIEDEEISDDEDTGVANPVEPAPAEGFTNTTATTLPAEEQLLASVVAPQGRVAQKRSAVVLWTVILGIAVAGVILGAYQYLQTGLSPSPQPAKIRRITADGKIGLATISRDGKYITYITGSSRQQSLWVMQVATGSHAQIVPPADETIYWGLTFSNDGDYIYYVGQERSNAWELYRVATLGGTPKKLLVNIDSAVTFSPDGAQMAFVRVINEQRENSLIVANADGTAERVLATRKMPDLFLTEAVVRIAWSPDGKSIACPAGNAELASDGNSMEVVEVRLEDGAQRSITPRKWAEIRQVAWLGDGSGLVLAARDQAASPLQVWLLSHPGGEARRLTNDFSDYRDVSVTADSSAIVTLQGDMVSNIWVAPNGETASARQVTDSRYDGFLGLCWTPDGRVVYCSYVSGNPDIWIMDADGGNRKRLTDAAGVDKWPSVSADGRYVVFMSDRTGETNLWRMDINGSNPKQLTDGGGEDAPHCSPTEGWVYYSSARFGRVKGPLWKVAVEGGDPVLLADRPTKRPVVSPDGKLIAYFYWDLEVTPPYGVEVAAVEGAHRVRLFDISHGGAQGHLNLFRWTPEGHTLAYLDNRALNVWGEPLGGGKPVPLTDFKTEQTFFFDWSRDSKWLALARGTVTSDVVLISNFK